MKPQNWWVPGKGEGLLSRKWALVYVFPLPNLSAKEIDASLRFRVQAMLPSANLPLQTRSFRHGGRLYGVVVVDRRPDPTAPATGLVLAVPLILPPSWPAQCVLAIRSPEGWELHSYEDRVLESSYPPVDEGSPMLESLLHRREGSVLFWLSPDASLAPQAPSWARIAPRLPHRAWGVPLVPPKTSRFPTVLLSGVTLLGLLACFWAALQGIDQRDLRNRQWQSWVVHAQETLASHTELREQITFAAEDEPLYEVLVSLGRSWPKGVEIRKLELKDGRLSLTARASSALGAVTILSREALWKDVRVSQIRPISGGEEFDLEGRLPHDR